MKNSPRIQLKSRGKWVVPTRYMLYPGMSVGWAQMANGIVTNLKRDNWRYHPADVKSTKPTK